MTPIHSLIQLLKKVKSEVFGTVSLFVQTNEPIDAFNMNIYRYNVCDLTDNAYELKVHSWDMMWEHEYDDVYFGTLYLDVSMIVNTNHKEAILTCDNALNDSNANILNIEVANGIIYKVNGFQIEWTDVYVEQEETGYDISERRTGNDERVYLASKSVNGF